MKGTIRIKTLMALLLLNIFGMLHGQDMLGHYLKEAAEHNPGLKASYNAYMAELEKIPQAGAFPDPEIGFGYFIQPVETRVGPQQLRISASQMLPWFGMPGAREDLMTEKAKASREALEEAMSELAYEVKVAYYNLYLTERSIDITRENVEILNTLRKLALNRLETGTASAVDVLRVEIEISDLENQLVDLMELKISQQVEFNNLLNVDPEREVLLPDELSIPDVAFESIAIRDSIRQGNHAIKRLDFLEQALLKQEDVAGKSGMPSFSVGIDYIMIGRSEGPLPGSYTSGRDAIIFPKIGVSIPIYRKKYKSMVREAVYMQDAVASQREEKLNRLETLQAKTGREYRDAGRRLPLYRLQAERAEKVIKLLETEYATMGTNFEEILRMERQLLRFRLETEKARADKNAAFAFVNFLLGK